MISRWAEMRLLAVRVGNVGAKHGATCVIIESGGQYAESGRRSLSSHHGDGSGSFSEPGARVAKQ